MTTNHRPFPSDEGIKLLDEATSSLDLFQIVCTSSGPMGARRRIRLPFKQSSCGLLTSDRPARFPVLFRDH